MGHPVTNLKDCWDTLIKIKDMKWCWCTYIVLCLHHLYGIQALLKSLLKHHLTQQKMHLTIFIKTMKSFDMIMLHSFYPLHLKSRCNYNHLPRIWFFFDESNTGTSSSAWRWHPPLCWHCSPQSCCRLWTLQISSWKWSWSCKNILPLRPGQ